MNPREVWFIVNPVSGTWSVQRKNEVVAYINAQKSIRIFFTEAPKHATEIAREAASLGIRRVVAVGGDGTVNEVATGLLHTQTALGIVPIGSGNGLARHLKLPLHPKKAIDFALHFPSEQKIDAALLGDIPFFCTAGIGFDATVAHAFASKRTRGLLTYARTTLEEISSFQPQTYLLDNETITAFSLTFANAGQFGNNAWIAPQAIINDGLLDLAAVRPFSPIKMPIVAGRLFAKNLPNSPLYTSLRKTEFLLQATSPLAMHYDGEPITLSGSSVSVKTLPKALRVVCG